MRLLARLIGALALVVCLPIPGQAQSVASGHAAVKLTPGFPHDWSHRHLIFSKLSPALKNPPPRYSMQQAWRKRQLTITGADLLDAWARRLGRFWGKPLKVREMSLHRDWGMSMGTSATVGEGMYPAKYSFDTGSANCGNAVSPKAPDFVVYNTGPAGAATGVVNFPGGTNDGDTVTVGANTYTFKATVTCNGGTPPTNCVDTGNANASTGNLQAAIMANPNLCSGISATPCYTNVSGPNPSVTATSSRPFNGAGAITLTARTTGAAGNSIPLSTTAAAGRITVSGSTLTGGADTLATIVAYDNLYAGCTGTVPQAYWQYNTGYNNPSFTWDHSVAATSVVLSGDGSQVAFVQNASAVASLVILKWAKSASLVQMNTSGTNVAPANYHGCTAPCMTRIAFGDGANDSRSAPFYDYSADALYVGDDSGALHKFTGVFGSVTPAEAASPWPITVSPASALSSPVYDSNVGNASGSGNIYFGDSSGHLWYARENGSTVGACTASGSPPCLGQNSLDAGNGSARPIMDAPIVDSGSQKVFAFIACSGTAASCGLGADSANVVQAPLDLGAGSVTVIGTSSREGNTFDGDFDNNYYSGNYANGHLYACGNLTGGQARTLYRLGFTATGQLSTSVAGPALAAAASSDCLSITEIFNGATDRIFMSVPSAGITDGCSGGGCLMSFVVTAWNASTAYTVGQEILDGNGTIEEVATAGVSGSTQPVWPAVGSTVTDGSVSWTNQGAFLGTTTAWHASQAYATGQTILDSNFNLEIVTAITGDDLSGTTQPTWPTTVGGTVTDHHVTWANDGPGNANLAVSGGASGAIMDNTVGAGTLSGASQVYFSPLLNGTCGAFSSVGCAVQASQQGLQ